MKLAGILLFVVAFINTLALAYGFRGFSLQLTAMFLITILGLPLGSHLAFKNFSLLFKPEMKPKALSINFDEDECDVVGKFVI